MKLILAYLCALFICPSAFASPVGPIGNTDYELVAASQSTQTLGPVGGAGDILDRCIIVPETTGAGTVAIKDGSNTAINIFVTGTLTDLSPLVVAIGARSASGAWQITTGANVHAVCVGRFK
jgi:hypothetical protein